MDPSVNLTLACLVGFGSSSVLMPLVLWMLRHLRSYDLPSERSSHQTPTLRGGGIAIAGGAIIGAIVSTVFRGHDLSVMLLAATGGVIGLCDDLIGAPLLVRLGLQCIVAASFTPFLLEGVRSTAILLGVVAFAWIVACMNIVNFMDGLNGLAIAQVLVVTLTFFIEGCIRGDHPIEAGAVLLGVPALAFLPWNFPLARVFLGDVGSYFIGAWLAGLAITAVRSGLPLEAIVGPFVISIVDVVSTIGERARRGEVIWHAHRCHVYQRLHQLGWNHSQTTGFFAAMTATTACLGAVSLSNLVAPRAICDCLIVVVALLYTNAPRMVSRQAAI